MTETKTDLRQLAILGGPPVFSEQMHVGRPNIGDRESLFNRINNLLDRRWLTNNGPYVKEFEEKLCDFLGVKHCFAICNGTVGLEIAIKALGLTGEVIVPSMTFIATAHSLRWLGIDPVFCDVNPDTHNIDPLLVESLITPRTTGIMGVHLWGRPCEVDALGMIARRHHIKVMYDAAHAFGCSHNGRFVGNFGDAEVFSFHATKFFNTFEGGAITTNDDDVAEKIKLMRNFGFAGLDHVVSEGTNGKMSEVSAAMGLTSLESMDGFIKINHQHYHEYREEISGIKGLGIIRYDETEKCNFQYIVVDVDDAITRISRDQILNILQAENILARRYFFPGCHRMQPYYSLDPDAGLHLPNTEKLSDRLLVLPSGTAITSPDIKAICSVLKLAVNNAEALLC